MPETREFSWINITFLLLTPIVAFAGVGWYAFHYGVHWADLLSFAALFALTGLGITAGYHRHFSHRTYDCHPAVKLLYLVGGAAAFQNSALHWCSDHRNHHRFVDEEQDPYNIMRGVFWAHIGWVFYKDAPGRDYDNVKDLQNDPLVMWQHRWYLPLSAAVGFVLPALIGWAFGRPMGGLLWGGFLRTVVVHHSTFLINSAAHFIGSQPYSDRDSSRDNWVMAFLALGEGYHNFHHTFQGDYRNGIRWYHWDPSKWWISALEPIGLTWRLNRAPEWAILKARMEMEYKRIQPLLELEPAEWRERLYARFEAGRLRVEAAVKQAQEARARYQAWARGARSLARRERRELQVAWSRRLAETRRASAEAWSEYRRLVEEFRRRPAWTA